MNEFIEFFTDPLRLTLLVAAVVVILGILIFGRRSQKMDAKLYSSHSQREFRFNNPPPDMLVDEEVIVLPPRKKAGQEKSVEPPVVEDVAVASAVQEFVAEEPAAEAPLKSAKVQHRPAEDLNQEMPMKTFEYQQPQPASKETVSAVSSRNESDERVAEPVEEQEPRAAKPALERFIVLHVIPAHKENFNGKEIYQVASALGMAFGKHNVYHFPADAAREGNSQFCMVNMTAQGDFDKINLQTLETKGISLILRLSEQTKDGLALFSNMLAIAQGMSRRIGGEILDQTRAPLTPDLVTHLRSDIAKFHTQLNQRKQTVQEV